MASQEEMPQISYSELTDLEGISQGGFGLAYRAKHARFGTVVYKELDVKILGNRTSYELKKEAQTHVLRHENIVTLHATVFEPGHYGIVMEYVHHGALDEFISNYEVGWPLKLSFAHNVVCGMKYLHSRSTPVIHSDLSSRNVLISENYVAKICDFGLAKWKQQATTQSTSGDRRGTVAYMAPEVFQDPFLSRTVKYDVYGFGIFLWELLSEQKPFENASNNEQMIAGVMNGGRPPLDVISGPADLLSFATKWISLSWHQSPEQRPTFADLEVAFDEIRKVPAANTVCPPVQRQTKSAQSTHP